MSRSTTNARVYIYASEYKMIYAAAREFINDETGGDLYGTFTHGDMPIIWLASGPGPRVKRNRVHFEQDTSFTTTWQRQLMQAFGVQYIGSWHSHHSLSLREPSGGDREAARTYALNHNRRRTLEIIVTHERNNDTTLWFYYYPDAARESWQRAEQVLLPGVSPLRLQLDATEERQFSGGTNWKMGQLPSEARSENARIAPGNAGDNSQQVDIPAELNEELESVSPYLEDVTQAGNTMVIRLSPSEGLALDVYIDLANRILFHVDLLDKVTRTKQDISSFVRQSRFSIAIGRQSHVLHDLLSAFPSLQQQMEFAARQAELESQAVLQNQDRIVSMSPMQNPSSVTSKDKGQIQLDQQMQQADPELATKPQQVVDVHILGERNQFGNYDITVTAWKMSNFERIREIMLQLGITKEQIQFKTSEQANKAFITMVTVQSVELVHSVMHALGNAFDNSEFAFDKATQQDLEPLVHSHEGTAKEGLGGRFLRAINIFGKTG